jgi:hypothetical protein
VVFWLFTLFVQGQSELGAIRVHVFTQEKEGGFTDADSQRRADSVGIFGRCWQSGKVSC